MRRIYESDALNRDDEDPFRPGKDDEKQRPQAAKTLPATTLSNWLVPRWLRYKAVTVSVSTPRSVYEQGDPIPITIRMHNSLPFPITLRTRSRRAWSWEVDGHKDASQVPEKPTQEGGEFVFDRGEHKRFKRTWHQMFQVSSSEWEQAATGDYAITAAVNVDTTDQRTLADQTTVRIE